MVEFSGLQPTGRQFKDPAATLVELADDTGLKHTAIVFDEAHRGHPHLGLTVQLVLSFLEYPMVKGLVELSRHDLSKGVFIYPTGQTWTLRELLRKHDDLDKVMGPRAALELGWLAAQILAEAADTGPQQGCFSHGSLSPWRIGVRPDGQLQVFGYGLPQIELVRHRDDPAEPIDADSVRYAPPERLSAQPEDLSSDLFSLACILYEVATGEHLFDGHDVALIGRQILSGEPPSLAGIPRPMAQLLARCLSFDPDDRPTAPAFLEAIGNLMNTGIGGDSLEEILVEVVGIERTEPKRSAPLISADTGAYTPQDLATLASAADTDPPASDGEEIRWGQVSRERKAPAPAPPTAQADGPRRRRRRRAEVEAEPAPEAPRRRRRRRLDTSSGTGDAEAALPTAQLDLAETPRQRRARRISSSQKEPDPTPEGAAEAPLPDPAPSGDQRTGAPAEAAPKPTRRPRLTRSGTSASSSRRRRRRTDTAPVPTQEPDEG